MDSKLPRGHGLIRILATMAGAVCISALGLGFAISFAALIYTGPLSSFLGSAIVLTLVGAAIMVVVGAMMHRLPVISQPQDTTALLLAGSVASITAADPMAINGPTVAVLIALFTAITGVVVYVAGRLRVGYLARYIPFPVMGGFLAATGYLLTTGAIGLLLDRPVHITDFTGLLEADTVWLWLPWLILAAGTVLATRIIVSDLTLPVCVSMIGIGFYLWLYLAGIDMQEASDRGWLLGPFTVSEEGAYGLSDWIAQVDPAAIGTHLYLVLGIIALTVIGALLNMSGLEVALKRHSDLDADLRAVGVTNMAASMGGGLVGWPMIGESLLAARFNLPTLISAAGIATACLLGAVFGGDLLWVLPRGLFAILVGFLGIDLLVQWLWTERRGFPARDFAILLLILLTAMTVGFLTAIAVGIAAAAVLFVISYAQLNPVFARTSGAVRRSVNERSVADDSRLTATGEGIVIVELTGFVFFGSAHRLSERVRGDLGSDGISELIVDFGRVTGVDVSAIRGIVQIAKTCAAQDVRLTLSAVPPETADLIARQGDIAPDNAASLDDALRVAEDRLLLSTSDTETSPEKLALEEIFTRLAPSLSLAQGEMLFAEGSTSSAMFILHAGTARAEVLRNGDEPFVVRRHMPGSMIGEIAFCTGMPRTASIIAETPCELAVIDLDLLDAMAIDRAEFYACVAARLGDRLARVTRLLQQISH